MKTPAPQRAAGRKKLAAAGQALPDGTAPVPDVAYLRKAIRAKGRVDPAKWPALKALIIKRARQLGATSAPGVKGTWPFQAANEAGRVIGLVGPKGYEHGWIHAGVSGGDAPEERAGKMSANAFRGGDGTQGALQGHRDAAKAHRQAAQLASSPAQSAYHAKMAALHSRVASMRMTSSKASDQADGLKSAGGFANDSEAISLATATARRVPVVRGAADVQLSRTAPGKITAMHKSSGMKIGVIAPTGHGYTGTHADGTATGASGSQQGALTGLIAYHNQQAAKGLPPAQQGGTAVMPGSPKTYTAGASAAVDLAGSLPASTPANSSSDGPRVTSMGTGKPAAAASGSPAGLSPYAAALYKKFLAKKMKPAVALAFAKRADAMHLKSSAA